MATPRGAERIRTAAIAGATCAAAGLLLALGDRHLVAASLDVLADHFRGSSVGLTPIARALGEGNLRPLTRTLVSGCEGLPVRIRRRPGTDPPRSSAQLSASRRLSPRIAVAGARPPCFSGPLRSYRLPPTAGEP